MCANRGTLMSKCVGRGEGAAAAVRWLPSARSSKRTAVRHWAPLHVRGEFRLPVYWPASSPPAGASSGPRTPLNVRALMRRARLISQSPPLRLSWSLVHETTESGSPLTDLGACLHEGHRLHTMIRGPSTNRRKGLSCTGALYSLFLCPWSY